MSELQFENQTQIGFGIYTVPDLAQILNLKYYKVQRVLNEYWDRRFYRKLGKMYSWSDGKSKAVSFHTLVEFYTFFQLRESGVKTAKILSAHQELSEIFETPFPFATSKILKGIKVNGKNIAFQFNHEQIMDINMTKQLNLEFIKVFLNKLEFDESDLAERLWPLGKDKYIVVDPQHQFGQPTIRDTNILPSTIYRMYQAKEPIPFIAATYNISENAVNDAISYCKEAA